MTYDAVVFDMDGVLVEPSDLDALAGAARAAFDAAGVADPPAEHVESMVVGVTVERLRAVCRAHDLDPATFWRTRDATAARTQVRAALDGGKRPYDDVDALADLDVPLAVVSSNQQATVDFLLAHYGLAGHFEVAYGRTPTVEDLRRKKPDPHFPERATAALDADRALFVGDSESDVRAAHAAGLDAAFVRRPHRADVDLTATPDHEVTSLATLVDLVG